MKNVLLILSLIIIHPLFAQEKVEEERSRLNEIGLVFNNLNNYGISYRIGKESALWRFTALNASANQFNNLPPNDSSLKRESSQFGIGLQIGREYRSILDEKLEFRYGFGILGNYNYSISKSSDLFQNNYPEYINISLSAGFFGIIGFNYLISQQIILGAEITPSFSYGEALFKTRYQNLPSDESYQYSTNFNLNSSTARLSLMFRF